jgi:hypothetical protein
MKKLILLLFISIFAYNCSDDDDTQEEKEGFYGSIEDIREFYNDDLVDALEDLGFIINTGNNPPQLDGDYFISPMELEASTVTGDVIGTIFENYSASFSNQDNTELTIDFSGVSTSETDEGSGSFISGDNNKFSIFLKLTSLSGTIPTQTAMAITGEVVENGLKNIRVAVLMLDDKGDPENVYIENNTGRLFFDSDGLSPKQ